MKEERSFTSGELIGKPTTWIAAWSASPETKSGRKSRLALGSTNKVKAGLKKLEKLGIR